MIVGVDEAGVGCLAGPLVIVAAAFDDDTALPSSVRDSKKLNENQREELIDSIYGSAAWVIIKVGPPAYINEKAHIWLAWDELMLSLLQECRRRTDGKIIVDGARLVPEAKEITFEVKADETFQQVSAASIVAKYVQTCAMEDLHELYPKYKFDKHHGYATAVHKRVLMEVGPCEAHRFNYAPVVKAALLHQDRELRQLSLFNTKEPTTSVIERR
jgi:ribonuclease HII